MPSVENYERYAFTKCTLMLENSFCGFKISIWLLYVLVSCYRQKSYVFWQILRLSVGCIIVNSTCLSMK